MDPVGLGAVAFVLVVGVAVGIWRRRVDGRLVAVSAPDAGRLHAGDALPGGVVEGGSDAVVSADSPSGAGDGRLDPALLERLGVGPAAATLLQFSTAFCAPCRAVRRVSAEVTALLPDVRHVEVDAESHLDEVRELGIWRTPTLLVVDGAGRVVKRATGVPSKPQLIAVLAEVLPAGSAPSPSS